ncbi:LysM peptidoglycan-binding domain-containing protein [Chitinophaga oryziterrae]|uniref:Peptidoglycan hydrolase n=1 Tax=Chitinophaga oryziterrae TaxID=1031224 RepID=A0A6N8J3S2_9BACT|nr:glucosaminidase domain-containing protein [Chitinophaga oryziterrae]MVT39338.1 LysM peptidoglycan-binding domain-containing protein [Chitinophaga oryziterrae]
MQLKRCFLVVSFLIGSLPLLKAQTMSTEQYIAIYKDVAINEMKANGIPASITLAQGVLETQSGNGWLVQNSNNHFGIKCKNNWTGATVNYDDDARQECFRKYNNAAESYRDHSVFLKANPRYAFLFQFQSEDYKSWAYGLKQAGYATSKTYPQQLIKIIEDYNLQQYTLQAEGVAKAGTFEDSRAEKDAQNRDYQPGRATAANPSSPSPATGTASIPKGVFEINGRKVIYLPAGTALIQVANDRDIKLRNLVRYNDLPDDNPLPKDMFVYLQKKGKQGKDDYHIVKQGETMYDIAQAEGIQLRWLRRRNRMDEGQEPAAGEKLALGGYASSTPRLAKQAPKEDPTVGDLSPKAIVKDVKDQMEAAQQAAAQQQVAQQAATPAPAQNNLPAGMMDDLKKVADVKPAGSNTTPAPAAPVVKNNPAPAAPVVKPPVVNNTPAPVKTGEGPLYHEVQPKETLYGIAKQYNVTIVQLQEWNHIDAFDIKIGQRLLVGKM